MESISFDYRRRVEDNTYDQSKELGYPSKTQLDAAEGTVQQEDFKVDIE